METQKLSRKLLKAGELAERFNYSKSGIYKLAASGRIPHVKLGTAVRFDFDQVLASLQK
jgi:excisionase family DNA binding protein